MSIRRFVFCAALSLGLAESTRAATNYVATSGSDAAEGTSWVTAKQTIQAAVDLTTAGDTVLVSNGVYSTGSRVVYGALANRVAITNAITVQSVNGPAVTIISGAADPVSTNGDAAVRCAYLGTNACLSGFTLTNGHTRTSGEASREQSGGGTWCATNAVVSNCVLSGNSAVFGGGASGGMLNNCALSGNSASFSGGGSYYSTLNNCALAANSTIYGGGAFDGTLNNCLLTDNSAGNSGGGAYQGTLNNCQFIGNQAAESGGGAIFSTLNNCWLTGDSADFGGGASDSTLNNCLLTGNSASNSGGGAYGSLLNNCTLTGNSASNGGGARVCTLRNCIVYFNTATTSNNYYSGMVAFSCTTPLPSGTGNFANDPVFVSLATTNLTLAAGSPCRDTGNNAYAPSGPDLDGNPRIANGYVDMGAYEYQGAGPGDYDGDGMGNGDERVAGTGFTDSNDYFKVEGITVMSPASISFNSELGRLYAADRNDALVPNPQIWTEFTNHIPGTGSPIEIMDTSEATNRNYRVRVMLAP